MIPTFDGDTDIISSNPFVEWGRKLRESPETALNEILSGTGARGTQQSSEPEDFLADLLAHPDHREVRTELSTRLDVFSAKVDQIPARLAFREDIQVWPACIHGSGGGRLASRGSIANAGNCARADAGSSHVGGSGPRITLARRYRSTAGNSTSSWCNIRPTAALLSVGLPPAMRLHGAVPTGETG